MWSFSKFATGLFCFAIVLVLTFASGCASYSPSETDMPWSAPASWEGTMPLPSGYFNRNE